MEARESWKPCFFMLIPTIIKVIATHVNIIIGGHRKIYQLSTTLNTLADCSMKDEGSNICNVITNKDVYQDTVLASYHLKICT